MKARSAVRSSIRVRQHDEQRCGIGGAVALAKRDFAECRHLAAPHLMQNLAGLRVLCVRDRRRLRLAEEREHAPSHIGRGPEQLHRRDDAIAAKRCAEPRNPAYGYGPYGVSVIIIVRSADDRRTHRLKVSFELSTRQ